MSPTTRDEEDIPSEDTPLLSSESTLQKPSATPVPWAQVWILLVLQLAEPLTSQVIYPFTPEVCRFHLDSVCFFSSTLCSSFVMSGLPMVTNPV